MRPSPDSIERHTKQIELLRVGWPITFGCVANRLSSPWPTGHRSRVHASGRLAGSLVPSSIVPMARFSSSSGYFSAQAYVVVRPL
jgi:hypothetical protein